MQISLDDQIKAMHRELALRKNVYRKRVADGRMSITEAIAEYSRALAVVKTLRALSEGRADDALEGWFLAPADMERAIFGA